MVMNVTAKRTDKDVLEVIAKAIASDEVLSIERIAERVDCHPLTVLRAVARLEQLERLKVHRERKPHRYSVTQ